MWLLSPLVLVLPIAAVIFLTGCTSLVRDFNRIRAEMTKPETDEEINNYGAFFTTLESIHWALGLHGSDHTSLQGSAQFLMP